MRIQKEINEVAARENELRSVYHQTSHQSMNGFSDRTPSPISLESPTPPILTRAASLPNNGVTPPAPQTNGITHQQSQTRRFIPNPNTAKGVMQKFFKTRGRLATVAALTNGNSMSPKSPVIAWKASEVLEQPAKALIPTDKPLRKGYVPVVERIEKELNEMKNREDELKLIRRKSQPDLMAALEAEQEKSFPSSRSSSPVPIPGRLRNARSYSQLLDEDYDDHSTAPGSLRPAMSLAELCDAADEEIESPRNLIQQWESRIKQSQDTLI